VNRLAEPARDAWDRGDTGTLARLRNLGLTFEEARALVVVIILAGTETMSSGAPRVVALLHDAGAWPRLDSSAPATIDAALEAALRLATPTQVIVRSCAELVTHGGHTFRPGERVFVSVYSMARSRRLYPRNPGSLRLGQPLPHELRHIWFGAGPHFCLGAGIARGQLHAVVAMLAGVPDLRIVRRRVATGVLFPAYAELVVRGG
jgi:cytochrome P450